MFLKVSYTHQGCIYLIKNTVENLEIILQFKITGFYFNLFKNVIYFCDEKAEFSAFISTFDEKTVQKNSFYCPF